MIDQPFLSRLGPADREALLELGIQRTFDPGTVLIRQSDPDDRLMLILQGRVKVTRLADGEHELMLAIRDPGEVLGELALLDGQPRVATVTALEHVEVLVMTAEAFWAHLRSRPLIAVALLEALAARFRNGSIERMRFASSDTLGRLAARIIDLADRYGDTTEGGITITMPISQNELATWTGDSRAGVTKALQTLRELGWVETERRRLIVRDIDALRARAA